MRNRLAGFLLATALAACGPKHASFIKVDNTALGRVVVYRNGVAFYERRAIAQGGELTITVPRDRVDDFLKSLTVVDARSNQPLPISIPRAQADDGAYLLMKLELPSKDVSEVVLTYVTEAPAWKPSYRVAVADNGTVMLEGWAIVDNTSGEDWTGVKVGVGSSSALSFKYDLWSVRQVQRETLSAEERFAVAPPTGVSPYQTTQQPGDAVLADLDDGEIRRPDGHPDATPPPAPPPPPQQAKGERVAVSDDDGADDELAAADVTTTSTGGSSGAGRYHAKMKRQEDQSKRAATRPQETRDARVAVGETKMRNISPTVINGDQTIVIEGYANSNVPDGARRANDRANIVKNELIDQGVAPARIKIVTKVEANAAERVRLVAQAPSPEEQKALQAGNKAIDVDAQPVGESNFGNDQPMTVARGSSAMVSMVRQVTQGEVVYLYDAESERGNDKFAFKAVRFKNPTKSTLETGPVTVYGSERFIGEGLTEPIPPEASAVVPFALDRQIVVEREDGEDNRLSRLVTLQRGVLTAQVQHIRRRHLTLTNRMAQPAKVFIRHTVNKGWTLIDSPPPFERIGDAHLFAIDVPANGTAKVEIAEATPMERTLDLNADVTLDMMKVYVDAPDGQPEVKEQIKKLLAIHRTLADLVEQQESIRRRLGDYRERMDELHAQIVTLQAVKTGGDLMTHLKSKMKDISDRVQKATIELVDSEEKQMLTRVQFQDALAELTLPDATSVTMNK